MSSMILKCEICDKNNVQYVETCYKCCTHRVICGQCARTIKICCLSNIMLYSEYALNKKCFNDKCQKKNINRGVIL